MLYAGVVSLLLFLMVAMFGGLTVFTRISSTFELILFGGLLVVTAPRARRHAGCPAAAAGPAAAWLPGRGRRFIALLVVVGVVAGALTGSATRMAGDFALETSTSSSTGPSSPRMPGGSRCSSTTSTSPPTTSPSRSRRHRPPRAEGGTGVFDVEAGTYRFYCSLHPDMEGTLKVS